MSRATTFREGDMGWLDRIFKRRDDARGDATPEPSPADGPAELMEQFQLEAAAGDILTAMDVASRMLRRGAYAEAVIAWGRIAVLEPELAPTAQAQLGAAWCFIGDHAKAIQHYELARVLGMDPQIIQDNIVEARQAMARPN